MSRLSPVLRIRPTHWPRRASWLLIPLILHGLPALAQADQGLRLSLQRDFGYGGGGRIQGRFTLRAEGPENLRQVEFLIDGRTLAILGQPPFIHSFSTGDFLPGTHHLSARGQTDSGVVLDAQPIAVEFITSQQAWEMTLQILMPVLGGLLALMLIAGLLPLVGRKRQDRRPIGEYGPTGGAVCPRCGFPFSRRLLSLNLLTGKLERCPHCRAWSLVGRASPAALEEAEQRLRSDARRGAWTPADPLEDLSRRIEESRYQD
jgi:hypothetical protein